jgi:hypothetical protein
LWEADDTSGRFASSVTSPLNASDYGIDPLSFI